MRVLRRVVRWWRVRAFLRDWQVPAGMSAAVEFDAWGRVARFELAPFGELDE